MLISVWAGVHHLQAERFAELNVDATEGEDPHLSRLRMDAISPSA